MKGKLCSAVVFLAIASFVQGAECPATGKPGIWSKQALYLCSHDTGKAPPNDLARDIRVYSPDRRKAVDVTNDKWFVEVDGKRLEGGMGAVSYYPAELSWAPDSRAFYITESDATSEIDGFHTDVYRVRDDRIEPLADVNRVVHEAFDHRHNCVTEFRGKKYNENIANIAGIAWVKGSDELLVVAEIVPDSDCGPRGYFGGYLLSTANGRILQQYSPKELGRDWKGVFGKRLEKDYVDLTLKQRLRKP